MAQDFIKRPVGSHEPRLVGDILAEMLRSDSPLAKGYRKHLATKENDAEKGGEV